MVIIDVRVSGTSNSYRVKRVYNNNRICVSLSGNRNSFKSKVMTRGVSINHIKCLALYHNCNYVYTVGEKERNTWYEGIEKKKIITSVGIEDFQFTFRLVQFCFIDIVWSSPARWQRLSSNPSRQCFPNFDLDESHWQKISTHYIIYSEKKKKKNK